MVAVVDSDDLFGQLEAAEAVLTTGETLLEHRSKRQKLMHDG